MHVSKRERRVSSATYVEGILRGDRSVLARAITLTESSRATDRQIADEILEGCLSASGNSIRVGVTGIPGAGKSSLIEALGKHLITERGEKIAVLAIDPSSQLSGGSILGDKTRMTFLAASEMAFIRPSPSRGAHGGVAQNTRDAILLCEAAGFRNILVETVGVGQAEAAVGGMVDFLMLVTLAGAGDELQGIKRGLMELADVVVVNKADGDNIKSAETARTEAASALHLLPASPSGWTSRAMCCSAHSGRAVADLWSCILEHDAITKASGWFYRTRQDQARRSMHDSIEIGLMQMFRSNPAVQQSMLELEQRVLAGSINASSAVRELLALFASK
ncbi:methylmalonyl Co-A mutase-associated GTPase MeaB [Telmatobacter sp. DSM 110680]|uniref:Methylmalonyl Co-A mutase-associated GTPase MeaB n=1 Tax=Telmatobacter sp. DSM 110680 TaxID=3036704 RepID=A0AAU7DLE3_9BACT